MNFLRDLLKMLLGRPNAPRREGTGSYVQVNGQRYYGENVSIVNGRVVIDGTEVVGLASAPRIEVTVHGNVAKLDVDSCYTINVTGAVGTLNTASGDVQCGAVAGTVTTVSGDVSCGKVQGNIRTVSGDVSHR